MKSFLEWLEEQKAEKAKRLKEDAVLASGAPVADNAVASPKAYDQATADNSVTSHHACVGLTDKSVLGGATKKKDSGFFGKDDFRIPKNVLSGEIDVRIDHGKVSEDI